MEEFQFIDYLIENLSLQDRLDNDGILLDNSKYLVTKDVLSEGVHFFADDDPELLAKKALRVNLSDIASMGGRPYGYFIGCAIPKSKSNSLWLEKFVQGLKDDNMKYNIITLGGDTTSSNNGIFISITMLGITDNHQVLHRSGAQIGDELYVTGYIGNSKCGLKAYYHKISGYDALKNSYNVPEPRVKCGMRIADIASSCIDVSDGLLQDAKHIAQKSKVDIKIFLDKVPISKDAKEFVNSNNMDVLELCNAGDDYELLFTASKDKKEKIEDISRALELKITCIGNIVGSGNNIIIMNNGMLLDCIKLGYNHFTD